MISLNLIKMKDILRSIQILTFIGCVFFFLSSLGAYLFKQSSTGMLPVISYPFREYFPTLLLVSIVLGIVFVLVTFIYILKVENEA